MCLSYVVGPINPATFDGKSLEDHMSLHFRYSCTDCEKLFEIPELLSSHLCSGKPSQKFKIEKLKNEV